MEATMTFDAGWHVNPLAGALGMLARSARKPAGGRFGYVSAERT
jgi:hypothetical protein